MNLEQLKRAIAGASPQGASLVTARQDGLATQGVEASDTLAQSDWARIQPYLQTILHASDSTGVPAELICAIASRETRGGNSAILVDGWGDRGNGYGAMQVDKRHHNVVADGVWGDGHLSQAVEIFQEGLAAIAAKFPGWSDSQILEAALCAYNFGASNVLSLAGMNQGTTGDDYGADTLARAQWFGKRVGEQESPRITLIANQATVLKPGPLQSSSYGDRLEPAFRGDVIKQVLSKKEEGHYRIPDREFGWAWPNHWDVAVTAIALQDTRLKYSTEQGDGAPFPQGYRLTVGNPTLSVNGHIRCTVYKDGWIGERFLFLEHWDIDFDPDEDDSAALPALSDSDREKVIAIAAPKSWQQINWNDMTAKVSQYFTVREVTNGDLRRIPQSNAIKQNIFTLAKELDEVREAWGSAILVNSWYRPPAINRAVGGVSNSQHISGKAVDIRPGSGSIFDFQRWLDEKGWPNRALGYGARRGFVHIDMRPGKIRWPY